MFQFEKMDNNYYTERLRHAIESKNLSDLKTCIKRGVDVNTSAKNGQTPLMIASEDGDLEIVLFMFEKGAQINKIDHDNQICIHYASRGWKLQTKIIQFLLDNGAKINSKTKDGETPLMIALKKGISI